MKIRIHETDFEGNPVGYTGEFFIGKIALDIVEQMKMNPFNSHLAPKAFMRQTLNFIGQESFALPDDPDTAAVAFLQKLTATGFAHYELDDDEFNDTAQELPYEKIEKLQPEKAMRNDFKK